MARSTIKKTETNETNDGKPLRPRAEPGGAAKARALDVQHPSVEKCVPQQLVHLNGVKYEMSDEEVAYHNRAHSSPLNRRAADLPSKKDG